VGDNSPTMSKPHNDKYNFDIDEFEADDTETVGVDSKMRDL